LWHPLTQHKTASPPLAIVKAKDALLWDENGNEYIDGIASWYTAMYGHCNEYITNAITAQMKELDFVMFSGFTHEPAVELSEKLIKILPKNQEKIFFNDNGSTAVEAAIKMALQYYHNKGEKRDTLIAFEDGFHGDTFGAMSASGLSSYGMKFHSIEGLDRLIKKCQELNILCVADEIMTGFGKTGKNFASDYLENKPDVMCLSKALTAGMFPLSITSCSQKVFDAFLSDEVAKGFFHAHTFSAHPLGCAAAIAGLELLESEKILERKSFIANAHKEFVLKIKNHPKVKDARTIGVILAIDLNGEIDRYGKSRDKLYQFFMSRGVNLRPLGNTIYTLPPYVITNEQLEKIYEIILELLEV